MTNPYNGFTGAERDKAWVEQKKLQKSGIISWSDKPCCMCEQHSPAIMPHLENYFIVHVFYPMCVECHMRLHARFKNPGAWIKFMIDLKNGKKPQLWKSVNDFFRSSGWVAHEQYKSYDPKKLGNEWYHNLTMKKAVSESLRAKFEKELKTAPEQVPLIGQQQLF